MTGSLRGQMLDDLIRLGAFAGQPALREGLVDAAIEGGEVDGQFRCVEAPDWRAVIVFVEARYQTADRRAGILAAGLRDPIGWMDLLRCAIAHAASCGSTEASRDRPLPSHYNVSEFVGGPCAHGVPPNKPCRECDPPPPPQAKRPAKPEHYPSQRLAREREAFRAARQRRGEA